jgi:hypothetical protein
VSQRRLAVAAVALLGAALVPSPDALARQPARSKVTLGFRVPAAGHYALIRSTIPFKLPRGARFPRS